MSLKNQYLINESINLDAGTKNISWENVNLEALKIYDIASIKSLTISKALEKILNKTSKKLLIKKDNKWSVNIKLYKRKEEKTKKNFINYWHKCNICADKYSFILFFNLKIVKYINLYFKAVYPDKKYPLFDEYEKYMINNFRNESSLILKINFFNLDLKNSENENSNQIDNDAINIVENNTEEEEYSFFGDVDKFCDNCLKNKRYDSEDFYDD